METALVKHLPVPGLVAYVVGFLRHNALDHMTEHAQSLYDDFSRIIFRFELKMDDESQKRVEAITMPYYHKPLSWISWYPPNTVVLDNVAAHSDTFWIHFRRLLGVTNILSIPTWLPPHLKLDRNIWIEDFWKIAVTRRIPTETESWYDIRHCDDLCTLESES